MLHPLLLKFKEEFNNEFKNVNHFKAVISIIEEQLKDDAFVRKSTTTNSISLDIDAVRLTKVLGLEEIKRVLRNHFGCNVEIYSDVIIFRLDEVD